MFDARFDKMAQVIVNYSIEVKPGQIVYVWSTGFEAQPLLVALYKEILKAGGNAYLGPTRVRSWVHHLLLLLLAHLPLSFFAHGLAKSEICPHCQEPSLAK